MGDGHDWVCFDVVNEYGGEEDQVFWLHRPKNSMEKDSYGAGYYSEFSPVNIHSKLHFRLNIITFSHISNLYSSSGGMKPFRFKFACKISKFFEIMYSLCSVGAGNPGNHAHD